MPWTERATSTFPVALIFALLVLTIPVPPAGAAPADGGAGLDVPYLPQTEALCGGAAAAMLFRYWGDAHADVQQFAPLVDRRAGGIADTRLIEAIVDRGWLARRIDGSVDTLRAHLANREPLMLLLEDRPGRYHFVVAVGADTDAFYLHDPTWGPNRRLSIARLLKAWKPSGYWTLLVRPAPEARHGRGSRSPASSEAPAARSGQSDAATSPAGETDRQPLTADRGATAATGSAATSGAVTSGGDTSGGDTSAADTRGADTTGANANAANTNAACERLLDNALDELSRRGLAAADEVLGAVHAKCPASSRPLSELAGVRIAQHRSGDAAALATEALTLDRNDTYAWDVLGSSRFLQDDDHGALRAWAHVAKPMLDSVRITGLAHTRYSLVAQALALEPNTLLTDAAFTRAERRLELMPYRLASRMSLKPESDGFAVVDVAVVERPMLPHGAAEWGAAAAHTVIDRELSVSVPGGTGQGELWTAGWRWWENRPRVAIGFAAPHLGWLPGVWRVDGSWESQRYVAPGPPGNTVDENRAHGSFAAGDWLTSNLRYEVAVGFDAWNHTRRTISVSATLERRLLGNRVALLASGTNWSALADRDAFRAGSIEASIRSSAEPSGLVAIAKGGFDVASRSSPLALWSGAGEGRARPALLRAHSLVNDGVIDGHVFGQRLGYVTAEAQRWLAKPSLVRLAIAAFADAAAAADRLAANGRSAQVDAGVGLRVRVPGTAGTLRVDYAHGMRDGADAIAVGWQY